MKPEDQIHVTDRPEYRVILLHGYGSTAAEMVQAFSGYTQTLTSPFIGLDAPFSCDLYKDKLQWFKLSFLGEYLNPQIREQANSLVKRIEKINVKASKTVLLGHSQGAMIAAYIKLFLKQHWKIICISGMLPFIHTIKHRMNRKISFIHGEKDQMIPTSILYGHLQEARKLGIDILLNVVPGAGHALEKELCMAAVNELNHIINKKK